MNHNKNIKSLSDVTSASLLILTLFILTQCKGNPTSSDLWHKTEGLIWNTEYHITYESEQNLEDNIVSTLDRIGKSLSVFNENSLVSKVNLQDTTEVDTDFIRVYVMSRKINKLTGGAFDPTLSPIIKAWGFGKGHTPTNDTARLDSLLSITGIDKTRLSQDKLIKERSGIEFNFSAIAKGYGCDAIGEMFESKGVKNYLIEIGGEILAKGNNQEGTKWRISVDSPFAEDATQHKSIQIISFTDMGMATSGNYRNYYMNGTERVGHTISSKTGRPVQTDIASATVIAPTAMEADALATSFMTMTSSDAKSLSSKLKLPVLLILTDSTQWESKQFIEFVTKI